MQLKIISIPVKDQQESKAFYRDILGFSVMKEEQMGPEMTWLHMEPPEGGAGIALVTWYPQMRPGSVHGLVLETEDIDALHDRLNGRGLPVSAISSANWGRYAMFSDIDGNGWILTQTIPGT